MSEFPRPGGGPGRERLVTFGLSLVILGWVVLLATLALGDAVLTAGSLVAVLAFKADAVTLAQTLVLTGLGLALLGGLRQGFGALNRFFDAVLQRSVAPRPSPMPEPPSAVRQPEDEIVTVPQPGERIEPAVASRHRNYAILPDGSVEVDTLLGTRIFASMDEARDFIR